MDTNVHWCLGEQKRTESHEPCRNTRAQPSIVMPAALGKQPLPTAVVARCCVSQPVFSLSCLSLASCQCSHWASAYSNIPILSRVSVMAISLMVMVLVTHKLSSCQQFVNTYFSHNLWSACPPPPLSTAIIISQSPPLPVLSFTET